MESKKHRILIVCMWPLGGIRTYLKYNYHYCPKDRFEVTLLAMPSAESASLEADMTAEGVKVVWSKPLLGRNVLFLRTAQLLLRGHYDLIHSQGFISGFHVSLVNRFFRKPHILTIHGVPEEKRFRGPLGRFKRWLFERVIRNATVIHGVGEDILSHIRDTSPGMQGKKTRWVAIKNGIDPEPFLKDYPQAPSRLRERLGVSRDTFVFGFFGRFMPEKGFDYVIEAVSLVKAGMPQPRDFVVTAVGSGDYETRCKGEVERRGVGGHFRFLPFSPSVAELMQGCDVVLMPSVWEAYPLLTSEVLCCGVPLIASDCIGLREAVFDTPAIRIPARSAQALAEAMLQAMGNPDLKKPFAAFRAEAARRFDVKGAAEKLVALIDDEIRRSSSQVRP
jgi:glycosyltransferase involved in cell wall biosynthesis